MHIRPPQKNRNNRNKNGRKPMGNVQNRVYESAGPEGKVRGTPQQIIEKYLILARDAQTSGDRVMGENFLQHAEHYIRLLSAAQAQTEERRQQNFGMGQRADYDDQDDDGDDDDAVERQPQAAQPQQGERRQDERRQDERRPDDRRPEERRGDERRGDERRPDERRSEDRRHDNRRHEERRHDERRDEGRRSEPQARAERPEPAPEAAAEAAPVASALETIDAADETDVGLVATPESRDEAAATPARKAGDGRRRRRRPTAETAEEPAPAVDEAQAG